MPAKPSWSGSRLNSGRRLDDVLAAVEAEALRRLELRSATDYLSWYSESIPQGWTVPEHVRLIAEHLDAVERGEIDRLAISMPPRHGKSETVTVRYPVYCLERRPADNVLVTGYNTQFARKFGRRSRNMAAERGLLAEDKTASDEWATTGGGLHMARGVGSPPTGTGFSRIVVDDPIKNREEADSLTSRDKAWDWYSEDLYSRLEPGGAMIMVATRWHHDDVMARAIASEPGRWTVLNLPAINEAGEALWPERYDVPALERIRGINPRAFEALYQGNPTPREGALFLVDRLGYCEAYDLPPMRKRVRAWDMGASVGGDWTAGVLLGHGEDGRFYVLDVVRARHEPDARNRVIRQTAERDGPDVLVRGPQDPGAAGVESAQAFTRLLAGYQVRTERVTGDKELRADPLAAQVNAGNVSLVRGAWNGPLIEEMRQFPLGSHDDQVDALGDAFAEMTRVREVVFY